MASGIYDDFKEDLMVASVNLAVGQDVLRVALMDNVHTFVASDSVWANVLGNEIVTLVNEKHSAGEYTIAFDASFLPSGIYIYKLEVSSFYLSKKMILLK